MKGKLKNILEAVTSIQTALLRFRDDGTQQNLQIRVMSAGGYSIQCLLPDEMTGKFQMLNRKIHLIQKYHNDYFFISGNITGQIQENDRVLAITVKKASWFVKRKKENVSWFQEKCTYENWYALNRAS